MKRVLALCTVIALIACTADSPGMSEEKLINEQVNRLSYIRSQPEIASGACGPFRVSVFADNEYEEGRPERYARQTSWYPKGNEPLYFRGIAVRIAKPAALDATGVEFLYTPVIDAEFNIAERVEWLNEKGEWRDVSEPFSFVTAHGPESPRWEKIYDSPFDVPAGNFSNAFWENQFVYSLPYDNLLEHVSRYAEPGDRFRIVKPHPVQLRWQGETCTIPIPDVEFKVTGREAD